MSRVAASAPANDVSENRWSSAKTFERDSVPSGSPYKASKPVKNWLNPSTCVGSSVWLSIRGRLSEENRAALSEVAIVGDHHSPSLGWVRFLVSSSKPEWSD